MFERDLTTIRGTSAQLSFVSRIYEGMTKSEACADMLINPAAVGYVRRECKEFDIAIRDAEAFRVDMLTDKLANIEDYFDDAIMAGVASKNIQWLASKRLKEIYGDKTELTVNHNLSITDAMKEAEQRTIEFVGYKVLDNNTHSTDIVSVEQPKISKAIKNAAPDPFE